MIPSSPDSPAIFRQIRAAVVGQLSAVPDAELLARFLRTRDEAAFELLVWRHGQLVWGVCRRTARDRHTAEDAFQATFLALSRRAGSVANRTALAGWLYRVAYRAAREAARRARGRTAPLADTEAVPDHSTSPAEEAARRELRRVIDEEVYRLPERFRNVFVLCELQGRTASEAAAALGCPVGTVESRLTRARVRLRERLTLRGVTAAGGVAGLSVAGAPGELLAAGVRAGVDGPGAVSAQVAALAAQAAGAVGWALPLSGALAVVAGLVTVVGLSAAPPAEKTPPSVAAKPAAEPPLPAGVIARLGSTRFRGPPYQIEHAAFSPDGKSLAVAGYEFVRVFDTATGLARFTHSAPWSVPRFTRTGQLVALYRDKSGLVLRRVAADGRFSEKVVCPPPKEVGTDVDVFALSADATRLAVLRGNVKVHLSVYDTATGRVKCGVPLGDIRKAFWRGPALSRDGSRVALVLDRIARVIATDTGAELDRWILPDATNTLGFSDDGQLAATSFDDPEGGNVVTCLRDVASRTTVQLAEPINQVIGYTFDRSGTLMATRDYHGVTVWDLKQQKIRHRLARGTEVSVAEFSPDSKQLMTTNDSGAVSLWDATTGKRLPVSADPPDGVRKLRFLSGGRYVAGYSGGWRTWDSKTGRPGSRLGATPNWSWWLGADLYPDGRLAAMLEPQSLVLTDGRTGRVRTIEPIPGGAHGVRFSADGRKLIVWKYGDITVWNLAPWRKESTVAFTDNNPSLLALSPDGKLALVGFGRVSGPADKRGHEAYDLTTGKRLWRDADPEADDGMAGAVSADGRLVAYNRPRRSRSGYPAAGGGLVVREFATGRKLLTVNDEEPPGDELALSPDGRLLAEGYYFKEGLIRLRDVKTGKVARTLRHKAGITSLAFSPDGKTLAAASNDAPVYLWDVSGVRPRD